MRHDATCAEAEKINEPQEPGTPHSHGWFKPSLDLLKPEARPRASAGRARLSARCSSTDLFSARLPLANAPSRSGREPRRVYVPNPRECVSYFTHSRQFFEFE